MAANLEDLAIKGLLLTHEHNYSKHLLTTSSGHLPRAVKAAMEFMEGHISDPITVTQVAEYVGVGMRALQLAFKSSVGLSPYRWLKFRRLEQAHAMLVSGEVSVTTAAFAWGFHNLGDFATIYRARYGQSPSKTSKIWG
jgi:transcriptional regulator GlxA family with amidase domain